MRDPNRNSTRKVATYSETGGVLDLQREGNFEEDERSFLKEVSVPILQHGTCRRRNILCFLVQRKQASRKNKWSRHQLRYKTASITSKLWQSSRYELKTREATSMGKATCSSSTERPMTIAKGRYKRCQHWKRRREEEAQLNCGRMGLGSTLSRKSQS